MPIIQATPENVAKYLYAAGTGTKEAIKNATSPQGILQWIVNFFTCGGVRRCNEMNFRETVDKLSIALLNTDVSNFHEGTKIVLDLHGCTACFSYGEASESTVPMVAIEVSQGQKTIKSEVNARSFENVWRILKLGHKYHIPLNDVLVTEEGKLNLRGVIMMHKDMKGENLENVDATGATFSGSDLTDANLVGTDFSCASLGAAILNGADMTDAKLVAATLIGASMIHTDLTRADLTRANLYRADLTAAGLGDTILINTNLTDTKLDKSALSLAKTITGVKLTGAQHTPADFNDPDLYPAPSSLLG